VRVLEAHRFRVRRREHAPEAIRELEGWHGEGICRVGGTQTVRSSRVRHKSLVVSSPRPVDYSQDVCHGPDA
jgi:hypothetical protein